METSNSRTKLIFIIFARADKTLDPTYIQSAELQLLFLHRYLASGETKYDADLERCDPYLIIFLKFILFYYF